MCEVDDIEARKPRKVDCLEKEGRRKKKVRSAAFWVLWMKKKKKKAQQADASQ